MRKPNWKEEGGQIFGAGSQATIAIFVGVKDPAEPGPCRVFYRDIGDYLTREEKLRIVDESRFDTIEWQTIAPNAHGDWINQRDDTFSTWPVIGDKSAGGPRIFRTYSLGLNTAKDSWCYNWSATAVRANIERLIDGVNDAAAEYLADAEAAKAPRNAAGMSAFLSRYPQLADARKVKWSRNLANTAARLAPIRPVDTGFGLGQYRPFMPQCRYLDKRVNDMVYKLPSMFPTGEHRNLGFYAIGIGATADFAVLAVDSLPDYQMLGAGQNGQFFPRWTYERAESDDGGLDFASDNGGEVDEYGYRRVDNITDDILGLYRKAIGDQVQRMTSSTTSTACCTTAPTGRSTPRT